MMGTQFSRLSGALPLAAGVLAWALPATASAGGVALRPIGTYATGAFDQAAAEIVKYDERTQRLFVVNAQAPGIEVLDIADPTAPTKVGFLACHAWEDAGAGEWPPNFPDDKRVAYDEAAIHRWLEVFCRRFFGFAQFKRSALPNGPKVSHGGSLSPRGDWRAPSDATAAAWLRDLERWQPS